VNDPAIPIFGGPGGLGAFTVTYANGLSPKGDRVVDGNSHIQAVTREDGRVHAEGFLAYSQSTNPANPHDADFTRAHSGKRWHRFPFTPEEIAAAKESETRLAGRRAPGFRTRRRARRLLRDPSEPGIVRVPDFTGFVLTRVARSL